MHVSLQFVILKVNARITAIKMVTIMNNYTAMSYVTGFGKIGLNAANNFFQYPG